MSSTNLRFIKMVYDLGIILVVMFMGCAQQVHEHVYKDTVIAPTCAEKGYTLHKCQTCGDEYKDNYIDKTTTHNYVKVKQEPTCEKAGYEREECSICKNIKSESEVEIPALGHTDLIDLNNDGACDKCGWEDPDHKHVWLNSYEKDENEHWKVASCHIGKEKDGSRGPHEWELKSSGIISCKICHKVKN